MVLSVHEWQRVQWWAGSLGSVVCQCRFRVLNLIQFDLGCQEECKEQFGYVEGETSYCFLEWLEGQVRGDG